FMDLANAAATDFGRDGEAHITNAVCAFYQRADRQNLATIEQKAMHDFADRDADREAGTPFELDDRGAGGLGRVEDFLADFRAPIGPLVERQAADGGARPDWRHTVAVLAEDEGFDLRWRHAQRLGQVTLKAGGVEHRAKADDAFGRQAGVLDRKVRQHIDR